MILVNRVSKSAFIPYAPTSSVVVELARRFFAKKPIIPLYCCCFGVCECRHHHKKYVPYTSRLR